MTMGKSRFFFALWRDHDHRIEHLEKYMSETTDAIQQLNDETNDLAARIDTILAHDDQVDATTAAELKKVSNRLKGLAATEGTPVPETGDGDQPVDLAAKNG